ncbi:hypothetical protein BDR04DRAFT_617047 [Suillus decipiens]|nr:hypothetical protein BDR04DRAFT_617047 [Suillus decipiens]
MTISILAIVLFSSIGIGPPFAYHYSLSVCRYSDNLFRTGAPAALIGHTPWLCTATMDLLYFHLLCHFQYKLGSRLVTNLSCLISPHE